MTTVNIHEAKTHLSSLLERVGAGERIVIAKAGTPVAELVPIRRVDIAFGALAGQIDVDAFEAMNKEIPALFDADLGVES